MIPHQEFTTEKEQELLVELTRIRATYSFQLGVLLTEVFFRKPWKIIVFPFLFIQMNIQFFSNRLSPQPSAEARPPMDEQCLLFICTDEEGDSSYHRCQKIAGEWRNSPSRKFIQILPRNVQNEQQGQGIITYPVSSKKDNASIGAAVLNAEWNQLLTLVLATHRPKYIIFDGPFPYAGMIAHMKTKKDSQWYWLRVDGIEDRSATERAYLFDKVLEFSFESPSTYRLLEPGDTQLRKDPPSVVLDGMCYIGASSPQVNLHALLKSFNPPLELVEFTSARVRQLTNASGILCPQSMASYGAAILPPSSELIATALAANLPVVCLIPPGTRRDVLHKIRRSTERFFVMFANADDPVEIRLCLSTVYSHLPGGVPPTNRIAIKPWIDQIVN